MTLPDFIIIGAMKCGTSTLAAQLSMQDDIFITKPKEPNFFSDDSIYSQGMDWYGSLYNNAEKTDLRGEASTHYTKLPTYPDTISRIKAAGLKPKLIYLIRDPIDRLISHYMHEWSQGVITHSIDHALIKHQELRAYSRYGEQLKPWVEEFGEENLLVLPMSMLKTDPQGLLDIVGNFLERGPFIWKNDVERVNVSSERIRRFPLHEVLIESQVATALRRAIVPKKVRSLIKESRQMTVRPEISIANRESLISEFMNDRELFLSLFSNRDHLASFYPALQ